MAWLSIQVLIDGLEDVALQTKDSHSCLLLEVNMVGPLEDLDAMADAMT